MGQSLAATIDTAAASATVSLDWTANVRTNFITNPSFEGATTTGWTSTRGSLTTGTTAPPAIPSGTRYLQYQSTDGSTAGGNTITTSAGTACSPGESWTASGSLFYVSNGWSSVLTLVFLAADGTTQVGTASKAGDTTPNLWNRWYVTGVAPAGAASVKVQWVATEALPSGTQVRFDALMLEKSATLGDYFDGSIPDVTGVDYAWTGTANASTSTLTAIAPTKVTVARVNTSDGTVSAVRNAEPVALVAGQWVGPDYEVPLDADFYYRATSDEAPSVEIVSPTYRVASLGRTLLKHPGQPALNLAVRPTRAPALSRPVAQGVFDVLGRDYPIAVSMRRGGPRGTLEVETRTADEASALLAILTDGMPLLLSTPEGYGLGNVYIAVGDLDEARPSQIASDASRVWSLPIIVVDRPAGAALAVGNTWADVSSTYTTWAALRVEGTWAGIVAGLDA